MKTKSCTQQYLVRTVPLVAVLCLAALAGRAATTESNLSKTFTVKPGGQLTVDADMGSIEIATNDRGEANFEVRRKVTGASAARAREIFAAHQVSFDQDGDRVSVHAKFDQEAYRRLSRRGLNLQVSFLISVPPRFNLNLRTAAGSITAVDIEGTVKVRTAGGSLKFGAIKGSFDGETSAGSVSLAGATGAVLARTSGGSITLGQMEADTTAQTSAGSITVKSTKAKLLARTSGGSIELGELAAPAEVKTSAGSIHVKSAQAKLEARTSGGSITVDDARDTILADTSAGSVSVTFSAQPQADCHLTTAGGSIEVRLDPELGFNLDARTSGGRVSTDLPVVATIVGEHKTDVLQGKLNGGGKALVLKTSAGNIRLRRR